MTLKFVWTIGYQVCTSRLIGKQKINFRHKLKVNSENCKNKTKIQSKQQIKTGSTK